MYVAIQLAQKHPKYSCFFLFKGTWAIVGGGGRSECLTSSLGHIWWPRQGSTFRLRQVRDHFKASNLENYSLLLDQQIRCGAAVLFHCQSDFPAQLQDDVVSGNSPLLSGCARNSSGLQERPALHVPRRELSLVFRREGNLCSVCLANRFQPVLYSFHFQIKNLGGLFINWIIL